MENSQPRDGVKGFLKVNLEKNRWVLGFRIERSMVKLLNSKDIIMDTSAFQKSNLLRINKIRENGLDTIGQELSKDSIRNITKRDRFKVLDTRWVLSLGNENQMSLTPRMGESSIFMKEIHKFKEIRLHCKIPW